MFKLLISVKASKRIKLLKRSYQEVLISALEEIKEDPLIGKSLTRELTGKFSFRVGTYRIIYQVNRENQTILVLDAGHRSEIYK